MSKVMDTVKAIGGVFGCIALATLNVVADSAERYSVTKYSDAIEAITSSNMWSSDVARVIKALPENESSEFYRAVMAIVKSDMWSSEKAGSILAMCKRNG